MAGAAQLFLLCCLLQGSLCQNWASFMPQSLQGLSGSCVRINCTFSILQTFDQQLDDTCVAIWTIGKPFGQTVFNSGLTGQSANTLQGNLTGNLRTKNCTTVFHNMSPKDNNTYYFRLQCNNDLKYSFPSNVQITMTDSLPKPVITPPSVEVQEGAPVRVECSAVAPCPLLPPALTWTPAIGDVKKNQQAVTSVMTFTASRLHNGQRLQCSALYSRQAGNTDLQYENNLTLRVLYPPNNTWVSHSGPVIEGTSVNLTCNTDANPSADKFTWYKVDGDQVEAVGFHALLSTNVSEADSSFFCQVGNRYGSQNSSSTQIDVQFPPKGTTVIVQPNGPILEGVSVSLLCKSRANPPVANYTWYKDDEKKVSGSSLNISNVDPSHRGHYRCEARNELGEGQSAATQLDIQYPPQNSSVSVDPSGPVPDGSSVTLTCASSANPAAVNFSWFRVAGGEKKLISSERDFTFKVTKLSHDQYFCKAVNVHGDDDSELHSIDVTYPPQNTWVSVDPSGPVPDGSSVTLTCASSANPAAVNFSWFRVAGGEKKLISSERDFTFKVTKLSHDQFFCKAVNVHGDDDSELHSIDVTYPPENTSVSVDPSGPVPDGSSVTLTCTSSANPAAVNFSWFRVAGGEKKLISSERDFTFKVTKLSHDQFFCKAVNVHGDDDSELHSVDVTFSPQILPSSSCVRNSSLIRCVCISQGNPLPSLLWQLAGEAVDHSVIPTTEVPLGSLVKWSQITLNYLDKDVSSLVCLSNNSVGSDRFVFNMFFTNTKLDSLGLHPLSLFFGSLVGAIGMMLVCGLMLLIFVRKGKIEISTKKGSEDTSKVVVADGTRSSNVNVIYDNKAFLEENEEESLHYASVNFAKLKDNSRGKLGKEEVRGLASNTSEYAEVRLSSRGSN